MSFSLQKVLLNVIRQQHLEKKKYLISYYGQIIAAVESPRFLNLAQILIFFGWLEEVKVGIRSG